MKTKDLLDILLLAALVSLAASCKKDNYESPESMFSGKIVYNGQPLGVSGIGEQNYLQFWQDGYELKTSFNCHIAQDGSYSAMLFDGVYKLTMNSNRGPWISTSDTVTVEVKGNTAKDFPVKPYYTISNIEYSLNGNILKATFDVTAIDDSRSIENIALLVNKTSLVSNQNAGHLGETGWVLQSGALPGHHELTLDITDLQSNHALYARVGLQIVGIDQWLFDPSVYKLKQ
jgi:hypothetical protein